MDRIDRLRETVLAGVSPLGRERIALSRAFGRILAEPVVARRAAPPFSCSAMDGYAVRAAEAASGEPLPVVQTLYAGDVPSRALGAGEAARIFTGAPLPPGADAVVREETARLAGDRVAFHAAPRPGENVRREGEDVPQGGEALPAGLRLGPRQMALCAAVAVEEVTAFAEPRLAVLATGDELLAGRTPNSNGIALGAALRDLGARVTESVVGDDLQAVGAALQAALAAHDAVFTIGGVSVGQKDFVAAAIERLGGEIRIHGVPMKPGKPFLFANAGGKAIFGLPGSPSACLVAFEVFARPAVLRMAGRARISRPELRAPLAESIAGRAGRARFVWAHLEEDGRVRPLGRDTAQILGPALADALIYLPETQGEFLAGDEVQVTLLAEDAP